VIPASVCLSLLQLCCANTAEWIEDGDSWELKERKIGVSIFRMDFTQFCQITTAFIVETVNGIFVSVVCRLSQDISIRYHRQCRSGSESVGMSLANYT